LEAEVATAAMDDGGHHRSADTAVEAEHHGSTNPSSGAEETDSASTARCEQ
jgi:hypothetical protein